MPDISYIVSAYSWMEQLPTCLYSLKAQTHGDFEVIVTDNSTKENLARRCRSIVTSMRDKRFRYLHTAGKIRVSDPYWSSEYGIKHSSGRWLCFPTDDAYYPPEWAQRMLVAAYRGNLDLVLCERLIAGPDGCGAEGYFPVDCAESGIPGYKPSFLVRRSKFAGWLNKPMVVACSGVDRTTLEHLIKQKDVRSGFCRGLYYVHN
jgi:glycosyltransferase involved in cell wall biosynthesis